MLQRALPRIDWLVCPIYGLHLNKEVSFFVLYLPSVFRVKVFCTCNPLFSIVLTLRKLKGLEAPQLREYNDKVSVMITLFFLTYICEKMSKEVMNWMSHSGATAEWLACTDKDMNQDEQEKQKCVSQQPHFLLALSKINDVSVRFRCMSCALCVVFLCTLNLSQTWCRRSTLLWWT